MSSEFRAERSEVIPAFKALTIGTALMTGIALTACGSTGNQNGETSPAASESVETEGSTATAP